MVHALCGQNVPAVIRMIGEEPPFVTCLYLKLFKMMYQIYVMSANHYIHEIGSQPFKVIADYKEVLLLLLLLLLLLEMEKAQSMTNDETVSQTAKHM